MALNPNIMMMLNDSSSKETKGRQIDVLQSYRKTIKVQADKSLPHTLQMARKLPRIKSPNPDIPLVLHGKEEARIHDILPGHMQNQGTRLGADHTHEVTLRHLNIGATEYLNPTSTLNNQKEVFRVNPRTNKKVGQPKNNKKSKLLL